ncbi:N-acetylmuramoyl-L-alanine amidase [Aureispira anguillae]|uniref:N-acetylmuramoyl-L-alanine amidase n=1 Tax=Aureispira anguillae TaxID=2864201 RepID=A0A915YD37_9BACT|nr:N-acetylmuramoyl-L-alanine amidase [Aureispira anguillae]BDS10858.1 N-acetylmuramoyl-L-alanine amidase [Aureispira anguillae]
MMVILDNGHGGMIGGNYQTLGKQYQFKDGTTIYEGEFNRAIKARVAELLTAKGIPYYDLVPENKDISLKERIRRANAIHEQYKGKTFLISIHADAGGGSGAGVFIAKQSSQKSLYYATWARDLFSQHFPESKHRGIKRKNFYVLRYSFMPAILLENFFMDNEQECKTYLLTQKGRDRIAWYIVDLIQNILEHGDLVA